MNFVDIGIAGIVLISALIGVVRGLTREVLSLISWAGAGIATFFVLPLVQYLARQQIANPMIADAVTAIGVFVLFLIIFSLISHFLSGMVRHSALGGIDRSLGFGFGIGRGIFLICLVEIAMGCFVVRSQQPQSLRESRFSSLIYQGSNFIFQLLPGSMKEFVLQQQQKRSSEAGELTLPSAATHQTVQAILEHQLNQQLMPVPKVNAQVEAQKDAEKLAELKPKIPEKTASSETPNYSQQQRKNMERLLAQEESE
jgi:membrane protein required for colicin V production